MPQATHRPSGRAPVVVQVGRPAVTADSETTETQTRPPDKDKKKKEKKEKIARMASPGTPLPTMGWPVVKYRLNSAFGHPDKVPALSKKELQAVAEEQKRQDAQWVEARHAYVADRLDRTIIALTDRVGTQRTSVINTKGSSGNTCTLSHLVSEHGTVTLASVLAADFNLASGNLGRRLGRDFGATLTLNGLLTGHISVERFREFMRPIRPTRYNVRVVSADNIIYADQNDIGWDDALRGMEALYSFCEFFYMDTLNKITDPVALANVDFSDVPVFTANVGVQESMRQLGTSMETLRQKGFADKVNHAVVAISNIPEGKKATDYVDYLNVVNDENEVVRPTAAQFQGQIVGIPHDPYIALDKVVDREQLQWETLMAYKRLVIATLQQNPMFWDDPSAANVDLGPDEEPQRTIVTGFKFAPNGNHPDSEISEDSDS
jgi:hypothetical protein